MSPSGKSKFDLSEKRQALLDSLLKDQGKSPAGGAVQRSWWAAPGEVEGDRERRSPLSFAQERFWFLDRLQPGNPVYHVPAMIPFHGGLDIGALRQSLADLVNRHAALRTTFDVEDGRPVQAVAPMMSVPLPVAACEGSTREERRARAQQMAQIEVVKPFDLQKGPLLRAVLFRIDPDEHWLLVTFHHIVYDAWSNGIFFRELAAFYEANRLGRAANLPELPMQYGDFARWQRRWLQGETLQKLYAYWKEKLADAPAVLELPLDRPRPVFPSLRGGFYPFTLPAEPSEQLRELGKKEQTTPFMTLLVVYKVLLYRYTGQRDLVVGTPMTSRSRSELEGLIGLFLNTLVLRTRLAGASTFRELLRQVRAETLEAYEHQDLPFEKLVEELQPDRNLNVNPLFQVFFVFQTQGQGEGSADEEAMAQPSTGSSKFDLSLYLTDTGREIAGLWEYNSDLFEEATIARMAGHFLTLAAAITGDPDARISDLPLLTGEERRQLSAWNQTRAEYPERLCAHQLFEAQARATPDALALVFQGQELTYQALNARSNQIAHRLRSLGVGPDVAVGICVERSIDMVAGLLGVLKAGGAYLPLDLAYPRERIAYMLRNGRARVLLTQGHLAPSLPGDDGTAVVLMDTDGSLAAEPETDPASGARPENLAYIIHTSGSTGTAKGVGMSHRALTNLTVWQNRKSPLGPGERTLQYNSFSFDVSFLEVASTLSTAGTLVLVSEAVRRNVEALAELLAKERIARLFMPYTALAHLAEHCGGRGDLGLCLKQVVSTGEPLQITPRIVQLFQGLPGCDLHNEYGPTETHFVTEHTLRNQDAASWPMLPPVGRCIANAEIHILDPGGEPVPVGVVGELYAGGLAVAREYVGNPAMTAERFVPSPFSQEPGARLYSTGDLARLRADGDVEVLGRRDHQVKVRGFRIELGEIEIVLGQHPDLHEVVVTARGTGSHDRHLAAYVVPRPGATPGAAELRRFLVEKLPDYMIPSVFVTLDRLPLGATGKVDRYRLPDPSSLPSMRAEDDFVPPRNEIEEDLARIWSQLLLCERVGINDNFFYLGGHSLLVVQLATRIRETFGVDVPLQHIFEAATLAELGLAVLERQVEAADQEELALLLDELESDGDEQIL